MSGYRSLCLGPSQTLYCLQAEGRENNQRSWLGCKISLSSWEWEEFLLLFHLLVLLLQSEKFWQLSCRVSLYFSFPGSLSHTHTHPHTHIHSLLSPCLPPLPLSLPFFPQPSPFSLRLPDEVSALDCWLLAAQFASALFLSLSFSTHTHTHTHCLIQHKHTCMHPTTRHMNS